MPKGAQCAGQRSLRGKKTVVFSYGEGHGKEKGKEMGKFFLKSIFFCLIFICIFVFLETEKQGSERNLSIFSIRRDPLLFM